MAEIVADQCTGLHFTVGDAQDLAHKVEWAWEHPADLAKMGRAARAKYESDYTAKKNYSLLMQIYEQAVAANN
jgi:glycosyltransferase involved in cell wall biosynthesis